jgi:hypothetical protein
MHDPAITLGKFSGERFRTRYGGSTSPKIESNCKYFAPMISNKVRALTLGEGAMMRNNSRPTIVVCADVSPDFRVCGYRTSKQVSAYRKSRPVDNRASAAS